MNEVRLIATMDIPEGKQAAAREALASLVAKVRETDDRAQTLQYEACIAQDGSCVLMIERYRDAAALGAHMQNLGDSLGALLAHVQLSGLHIIGELPDAMKAAFAEIGPRYSSVAFSLGDAEA